MKGFPPGDDIKLNDQMALTVSKLEVLDIKRQVKGISERALRFDTSKAIASTPEFRALESKLESLKKEYSRLSGKWFKGSHYQSTKAKIDVLEAFMNRVKHHDLPSVQRELKALVSDPAIDVNRGWGFASKTTTRRLVDSLFPVVDKLLKDPISKTKALHEEQDAFRRQKDLDEQAFIGELTGKAEVLLKKLNMIDGKNDIAMDKGKLVYKVEAFKKSLKGSSKDSNLDLYERIEHYSDLRLDVRALDESTQLKESEDKSLLNTPKVKAEGPVSTDNQTIEKPKDVNVESMGIRGWLGQKASHVGQSYSRTMTNISETWDDAKDNVVNKTANVISYPADFVSGFFNKDSNSSERLSINIQEDFAARDRDYFEEKLEEMDLFDEEKRGILEMYDELTHKIHKMLLSKDDREPGFLERVKASNREFYNRHSELCDENDKSYQYERFKAVENMIEDIATMAEENPNAIWRLIDESLLARIADLKGQGYRDSMTLDNLVDKKFYHNVFFTVKINGISLKKQMESCKMSGKAQENHYQLWFLKLKVPDMKIFNKLNISLATHYEERDSNMSGNDSSSPISFSI